MRVNTPRHRGRAFCREAGIVVLAVVGFALSAQVDLPMRPVPFTMQTAVVFSFAMAVRPRLAVCATAAYFLAAVVGLPVLSGWSSFAESGLLEAKTAGYVLAFVPAAYGLACAARSPGVYRFVPATFAAIVAHSGVLAVGAAWLSVHIGVGPAWTYGVRPFLVAGFLKSLMVGAFVVRGVRPLRFPTKR